jgi:hypothetical protein
LLDFLDKLKPDSGTSLEAACKTFALRNRSRGVVVVLGDFYDKEGYEPGLRYLLSGRYDVFAVQVLSPQELNPEFRGDLKLIDLEDEDDAEVSMSGPLIKKYKANLNAYCNGLRDFVTRRGGSYVLADTSESFDELVLNQLRRRGLLR